ncbi:hypothetical protein FE784_40385 [Paenibacillus hemerocallicola]|uniref:Uncharacterized protein n=1 Tax=Paenibacillus hemerocallicola TaxID=1172614 RepID=A0A5C4SVG8_9BACL|nr:hypothetical protein [Paenibacillus hemerocallicola]TNJ53554.1 hypothetical protein FE784_40385 [Paenibacillus hemerocallicola]
MSTFTHVILEVFCSFSDENANDGAPSYCKRSVGNPGYHCLENNCKHVAFTYAPNEIAYSDDEGEVPDGESWLGLGGEMLPPNANEAQIKDLKSLWKEICVKKIHEAYDEYMKRANQD